MATNDSNAASDAVMFDKFMGRVAVYLGILAGDKYDTTMMNMPGPSWEDPTHPMHTVSKENPDAVAG